jgi:hypothetical protein
MRSGASTERPTRSAEHGRPVNIVRTLRDSGRDVQQALGAEEVVKLRKPFEGRLVPFVMMAGS